MLNVNAYIIFKGNCRQAIEFYKTALSGEVLSLQTFGESPMSHMGPADSIMHSTMRVGTSTLMLSDDPSPDSSSGEGKISLAIGLDDTEQARRIFEKLAEGGSVIMPLQKTYWAEGFGMLTDQFGIRWMVNCEAPAAK